MLTTLLLIGASLIGALQIAMPAVAQEFPKKQPIKIVVPVPPGGATDSLARITADFLSRRIGQTVIVDNKPGASSTIGADAVARAPADGYTIFFGGGEFAVVPAVRKVPYTFDDFTYLVRAFNVPTVMLASPKYAPSSIQEMLADMKARPGEVRYGSTGPGAIIHIAMAMFERSAGVKLLHVPYQGFAPVLQGLLAGTVDITAGTPPFPDGYKVLANSGTKRHPLFANLPTLDEAGIKGASWDVWYGFLAPPNLPKPIADKLVAEITAVLKDPAAMMKFDEVAKYPPEVQPLSGEAFKKQVLEDNKRWKSVVDSEKITVEQ